MCVCVCVCGGGGGGVWMGVCFYTILNILNKRGEGDFHVRV